MTSNGGGVSGTPGVPVPWYRCNGWIMQSGGPNWSRYQLWLLGFLLITTPWVYTGPLDIEIKAISQPRAMKRRWPW